MSMTETIIALDPGGTTGWAAWRSSGFEPDPGTIWRNFWTGEIGPDEHHKALYEHLEYMRTQKYTIVCESFEFRQNRRDAGRDNINLMSREYIGVAKLFAAIELDHPVVFQTAAQGKAFITDEKLKAMGLYEPGRKHARDAMRHLLTYLIQRRKRYDLTESWKGLA